MRRRDLIGMLGFSMAWPTAAYSQARAVPVVGFLSSRSEQDSAGALAAFRTGLRDSGFMEGRNISVIFRWADGDYARLPEYASQLIKLGVVALFAAGGPPSALAAKQATSQVPIVFSAVTDPVGLGLVTSLSNPGGNLTGMSLFQAEIWTKTVALLKELVPKARRISYLINPATPNVEIYKSGASIAANKLGIEVNLATAGAELELEAAFRAIRAENADAVVIPNEPFLDSRREEIVRLARDYRLPAAYTIREYVTAGGLMSYGPSLTDSYRKAAIYLGRILRGEAPATLPVEQPSKFDFVFNVRTAKALGLDVPPTMLALADEVIE